MCDIRHRVGITAPAGRVYDALATTDGLSGWWTREVTGVSRVGEKLEFYFGYPEPAAVMEVTELIPDRRVAWRCVQGPDEWVGTAVAYDLSTDGVETAGLFTHADWREPIEQSLRELCAGLDVARQSVSKHLAMLEHDSPPSAAPRSPSTSSRSERWSS
jgi:uncharacterized protein YndB with AHSA1/START domain